MDVIFNIGYVLVLVNNSAHFILILSCNRLAFKYELLIILHLKLYKTYVYIIIIHI